jgi:hypothetical protein
MVRLELRQPTNVPKGAVIRLRALSIAIFREYVMSKYDSPNHAQFYIGVDGGRTSCRAFPRLKLAGALFLARREGTRSSRAGAAKEGAQICPLST